MKSVRLILSQTLIRLYLFIKYLINTKLKIVAHVLFPCPSEKNSLF